MKAISYRDSLFRGNIYRSLDISGAGMSVQRKRLNAISSNIANVSTTNVDGAGNPYLRRHVMVTADPETSFSGALREASIRLRRMDGAHMQVSGGSGQAGKMPPLVTGEEVEIPNMRMNVQYDPSHPDADAEGFVVHPDVNIIEEMVELTVAARAFDSNVTVFNAGKDMIMRALDL